METKSFNKGRDVPESTKDYIRKHFSYDPISGEILRNDRINSSGCLIKDGYLRIKVKGVGFLAHRLAWFLYYGEFPQMEIDHINRNPRDNRIVNLREATRSINSLNREFKPNKTTGVVGVSYDKTKRLKKRYVVTNNKKNYHFLTLEEAIQFRENIKSI